MHQGSEESQALTTGNLSVLCETTVSESRILTEAGNSKVPASVKIFAGISTRHLVQQLFLGDIAFSSTRRKMQLITETLAVLLCRGRSIRGAGMIVVTLAGEVRRVQVRAWGAEA